MKALRHFDASWKSFRIQIEDWLTPWLISVRKHSDTLIIVGASGGYNLPLKQVGKFKRLIVLDPDPSAEWIFRGRLIRHAPKTKITWIRRDYFRDTSGAEWVAFLNKHPQTPVLFSNFLGQLFLLLAKSSDIEQWKRNFIQTVASRSWASFHDRFSCSVAPLTSGFEENGFSERLSNAELLERFYTGPKFRKVELQDHETETFFPKDLQAMYFHWAITSQTHHLIEGMFQIRVPRDRLHLVESK